MAVTLTDLKDYLNIDYPNDDLKLERKLNAAIRVVEKYTNHSLRDHDIIIIGTGCASEFYGYPIDSITGAERIEYTDMGACVTAKIGDRVTIKMGISEEPNLDEAVLRIASTLYEEIEISETTLPLDVQLLLNQYRLDSFIS